MRFRDRAVAAGIDVPIIPGILPIENFEKMGRFARACGTEVPVWMESAFGNAETEEDRSLLATVIATELGDQLKSEGCGHLHFYTLNKPDLSYNVARALGVEPARFSMAASNGAA